MFDAWRDEVRRFAPTPLARLEASRSPQWFAGVLSAVRVRMTRRGKMLYAMLDDGSAQLEVAIFNELFEEHRQRLKEDQLIIIQGKVSNDDYTGGLRINADSIFDLQLAREARASCLSIGLNNNADAQRLQTLLTPHRAQEQGGVPVEVQLLRPDYECVVQLGPQWRVRLADSLLEQLEGWDATHEVEISYR